MNLQNEDGMSSLHFAAESGNLDIVKYLIGKVDDINLQDEDGMSSLHFAAQNGYSNIVEFLSSESKKKRLENMSTTSEENTSNIQLFQDNPSDVLMQFEDFDDGIQNDIYNKSEGKVNSQLENSDSQQLVDDKYWCMQ
ncbi:ankyrin repeat domain-containing protein [Wolbachia endosymbiont of Nilaparvata lugens]|uniref:ankyrin repeat domain-containing protein n=1 Tax=Wolbachia endosymbiont of Nilaparvata lugens TaxID=357143 RepID=UPI00240DAA0F|nr:ankyrin repeat domain-containing protein [Wolbachia endosymbiont of Nilaparvata lugens]